MSQSGDKQVDLQDWNLCRATQSRTIAFVHVVDAENVGEEDTVETIFIQEFGEPDPVVEGLLFLRWMSPQALVFVRKTQPTLSSSTHQEPDVRARSLQKHS